MDHGLHVRDYAGRADLDDMKSVLRRGRAVSPNSGYWHPGELDWWFFYPRHRDWVTTLWNDGNGPVGWVIVQPSVRSADMAVLPELRGGPVETALVRRAETTLGGGPVTVFAWANDDARTGMLDALGYSLDAPELQTFARLLDAPVEVPEPPVGFRVLDSVTDEWVAERAECHHRAFDPSAMTSEAYVAFRTAPGYDPELDVSVASDDGRIVAYAMAWADAESGTGQLEPVGTRPRFWRRGLGRVANCEAIRRMRERNLKTAAVCTYAGHAPNIAFYESCGFERVTTVDRWTRVVPA